MQVVAAIKIVPDDQDIQVAADRSLDFSKPGRSSPSTT